MAARDLLHGGFGTTIMQNPYYAAADRSLPYYGKILCPHLSLYCFGGSFWVWILQLGVFCICFQQDQLYSHVSMERKSASSTMVHSLSSLSAHPTDDWEPTLELVLYTGAHWYTEACSCIQTNPHHDDQPCPNHRQIPLKVAQLQGR